MCGVLDKVLKIADKLLKEGKDSVLGVVALYGGKVRCRFAGAHPTTVKDMVGADDRLDNTFLEIDVRENRRIIWAVTAGDIEGHEDFDLDED